MKKICPALFCCLFSLSCATTSGIEMAEREYPDLPEPEAAVSPPKLQSQSLAEVLDLELKVQQGLSTSLPLSKTATLGLVVDSPPAVVLEDRLPIPDRTLSAFLKRKIAVTDLNGMQAVQVEVLSSQKLGAAKEEQLRLSGPMPEMVTVADVLRPDYLLLVRFDAIRSGKKNLELRFLLDDASLESYRKARELFVQNAEITRSELRRIKLEQDHSFEAALAEHRRSQQQTSSWNEVVAKVLPALTVKNRDSSLAEESHRDFRQDVGRRLERIDAALAASPDPDEWAADIAAHPRTQSVQLGYADAWVTLVDTKKGTTLWKARFVKQDETAEGAYQAVVEGVLDRLYEQQKAGPRPVRPFPGKPASPAAKKGAK